MTTLTLPYPKLSFHTLMQVLTGSLLIALAAQTAIPLPFTPVPLIMQNLIILFLAYHLGPIKATATVALYLLEGALGLPVFSNGHFGIAYMMGPTGGYLLGFLAQAYLMGTLRHASPFYSFAAAWTVQMGIGILWLTPFVGAASVLKLGLFPFIPGAIIKGALFITYSKTHDPVA